MTPARDQAGRAGAFEARCREARCRSCAFPGLSPVLDLGDMPLSDGFVTPDELDGPRGARRFPLEVAFCAHCSLVQILETVPPEVLFCDDYPYFSSFSDSWLEHCRRSAEALIEERHLGPGSLVVEVASNDGYMLRNFVARGISVLGIDPAAGPAREAERRGIRTICAFFGRALGEELRNQGLRADVVLGNNVLAHVADLNGFVHGIARLLREEGVAVIECPYVVDLVEKREFDTIYHEHLCYFSVTALDALFSRHGLHLTRVERLPTHGGSLRLFVQLVPAPRPTVEALLAEERRLGVDGAAYYQDFAARVQALRADLRGMLDELRRQGRRIGAYGAPAKGTILLNYLGVDAQTVELAVDRNVHKHGKVIPGVRIPIHPTERVLEGDLDHLLLLPWNLKDEVLAQQEQFRRRGGKFIVPLPTPEII
ncbi:MAG: class I SAM-dependent methyltransferase [Planctomycetes bacterium]|nr:class I SAM-dependent methyltransferase [Planctomycetota bacterium]